MRFVSSNNGAHSLCLNIRSDVIRLDVTARQLGVSFGRPITCSTCSSTSPLYAFGRLPFVQRIKKRGEEGVCCVGGKRAGRCVFYFLLTVTILRNYGGSREPASRNHTTYMCSASRSRARWPRGAPNEGFPIFITNR